MAEQIVPPSFYQLASLRPDERKTWVRDTLVGGKVYFRKRADLNDPAEMRPRVVFNGTEKDMRRFARRIVSERVPEISPAKRLLIENEVIRIYKKNPESVEAKLHAILDDHIGVFCLTEVWDNELMWGHYGDGGRGIAIEFEPDIGLFLGAQKMTYTDEERVINRLFDEGSTLLEKSILMKRATWSYEQEWRVMARWEDEGRQERYIRDHRLPLAFEEFMRNQHGSGH